jgi:hypothetical protein
MEKLDKDILMLMILDKHQKIKKTLYRGKLYGELPDIMRIEDVDDLDYTIFTTSDENYNLIPTIFVSLYSNDLLSDYVYHIKLIEYIQYNRQLKLKELGI